MMNSQYRRCQCGAVSLGLGLLFLAAAFGQQIPQVGEVVEVRRTMNWEAADVLQVLARGRVVRVRLKKSGRETVVPIDRVRPVGERPAQQQAAAGSDFRVWSDKSGKYTVDAKLTKFDGKLVHLQKRDGSTVEVPLEKLSADDIAFVAKSSVTSSVADAEEPENPFSASASAEGSTAGATATEVTLTPSNRNAARQVIPSKPTDATYEPDIRAAPDGEPAESIALPNKTGFFEKVTGMIASPRSAAALIARTHAPPGKPAESQLDIVDLEAGERVSSVPLPPETSVLDVTGRDPMRILTRSAAFGFGGKSRLDVWELQNRKLAHRVSWEPYGDLEKFQKDVAWAAFLDPSHVMTASSKGRLVKWRVDDLEPIFRCQTSGKPQPLVTPGRRFLVASFDVGLGVMDTENGELAAVIETSRTDLQQIAFNPDGTKLAAISGSTIYLWDVSSGQLVDEIVVPVSTGSELDWVTENELLLGREYLFDLQRRIVLWQYKLGHNGALTRYSGDLFVYLAADQSGRSRGLFSARLPHGAARAAADDLSADQLLVLKPGSEVTIRMQTNLPPAEQQKAYQALKAKCEANSFTVASNSPLVLKATSKLGKPKEVTYRMFGSFRNMTREVTPIQYTLELFENQREIWKTSGAGGPGFHISLKKNETIDNAIERLSQPNASFFTRVKIPRKLARPAPNAVAYGATMLGFGGPRRCDPDSR